MSEMRDKLRELEREVREARAEDSPAPANVTTDDEAPHKKKKRALRRATKKKILVGAAVVLTFLLVWKKVNFHFVVFTSFWGFLGIVLAVFAMVYVVLRFLFDDKDE
jgi:cation transport ATPase